MSRADDHFSVLAKAYARGRFGYPPALFDWLASQCPDRLLAWDVATGSGQAVADLAGRFQRVIATDLSPDLLALAPRLENVTYAKSPAEEAPTPSESVDLITVAQAVHWFDLERFWAEVRRVAKPGGLHAFWGYTWPRVDPVIDRRLLALRDVLGPFWPPRAKRLHEEYRSINPPFPAVAAPNFDVTARWHRADYLAHISSWSSVRYYREQRGVDPLTAFEAELVGDWPDGIDRTVRWPLYVKAYRVR